MRGIACAKPGGSSHPILGEWETSTICSDNLGDYLSEVVKITPNLPWDCDICSNKLKPGATECLAPECPGEAGGNKVTRARIVTSWVSAVETELMLYEPKK